MDSKKAARLKREHALLLDAIDALAYNGCLWTCCTGPARIRDMQTCRRCAVLHRAHRMGLYRNLRPENPPDSQQHAADRSKP